MKAKYNVMTCTVITYNVECSGKLAIFMYKKLFQSHKQFDNVIHLFFSLLEICSAEVGLSSPSE